jgi:Fe-coproporphyrin III synthase
MRRARLKKPWLLRGWTDNPRTLLNWTNGDCRTLSEAMFLVAQACDGRTDFDEIPGYFHKNALLNKLIAEGMAEECSLAEGIDACQQFRAANNPYVRSIHWAITGRCDLKCRHCYMESPDGRYKDLRLSDIFQIIEQFVAANVHQVEITGGEPFLRDDLFEILGALAEKQIAVTQIYSNGALIADEELNGIKELGFSPIVQISFDGCGAHDAMRGIAGAEAAAIGAIRRLREHHFRVVVATSIDRANIGKLAETYELMKRLDIQFWRIGTPYRLGCWRQSVTEANMEEVLGACAAAAGRWAEEGRPFPLEMPGYASSNENQTQDLCSPENYSCAKCRVNCALLPDGTILPCPMYAGSVVHEQMPNLLGESFSAIWSKSAVRDIIDLKIGEIRANNGACADCAEFSRCGCGCRAKALAAAGDVMSIDPERCEMHKGRYYERFYELAGFKNKEML